MSTPPSATGLFTTSVPSAAFKKILAFGLPLVGFHFALLTFVTQTVQCPATQCQYGDAIPVNVVYAIALLFTICAIPSLQIAWHTTAAPSATAITLQDQLDRNYHTRFRLCFLGLNAASLLTIINVVLVATSIAPRWLGITSAVVLGAYGIMLTAYTVHVVTNPEVFGVLQGLGVAVVVALQGLNP
ncbi:hypothetical protein HGRIS_011659 [Hohenbuehelia grisea]|uniref:Uncharacterized protein n=1 Tax=Hohenbuehelia grisea TaxID=104357 RepID=A0ABR3JXH7_9AGAR